MIMDAGGTVGRAVAEYTGKAVAALEMVQDGFVAGCYGGQAILEDGTKLQFLIRDVPVQRVTEEDIEEVVFTAWPPTSRM